VNGEAKKSILLYKFTYSETRHSVIDTLYQKLLEDDFTTSNKLCKE